MKFPGANNKRVGGAGERWPPPSFARPVAARPGSGPGEEIWHTGLATEAFFVLLARPLGRPCIFKICDRVYLSLIWEHFMSTHALEQYWALTHTGRGPQRINTCNGCRVYPLLLSFVYTWIYDCMLKTNLTQQGSLTRHRLISTSAKKGSTIRCQQIPRVYPWAKLGRKL